MLADAAKLNVGSGASQTQYGICERPDWQAEYNPVLKAYGVTAFTETEATLDTPAALKAWGLMIDPMLNGEAVPEAQQQAKNCLLYTSGWLLAIKTSLQDAGGASPGRAGVPPSRPTAFGHCCGLLPLDPARRLALRAERMARPPSHGR